MYGLQTLDKCAVICIHDLLPRKLATSVTDNIGDSGFLLLSKEGEKLVVHENLGFSLNQDEMTQVKKFFYTWGGGQGVNITNGVLEMELPTFLAPFVNEINSSVGCRVSPNLLRIGGDVYIYAEFDEAVGPQVSKTVIDFLSKDHLFEKDLIYIGNEDPRMPTILRMYMDSGYDIDDLFLISTIWEFREGQQKTQNEGVFRNIGNYIPKGFVNGSQDKLIYRLEGDDILGNAPYEWVNREKKLAEFKVRSKFFSDFYNYVIKLYSGPVFCDMQVTNGYHKTYYIVEKERHLEFIKGVKNHWNRSARSDHINYISYAGSVENGDQ